MGIGVAGEFAGVRHGAGCVDRIGVELKESRREGIRKGVERVWKGCGSVMEGAEIPMG